MRVLHLSKSDIQGGAARAAYRLHTGLRKSDVDSKMLVDNKLSDDPNVYGPIGNVSKAWSKVRPFIDRSPLKFYDWQKTPFHPAWAGRNIVRDKIVRQANIIHLHWIVGGFLSIKSISRLAKLGRPIVWTLHDMWAFTGGCHYSGDCEKYLSSCGACLQLNSSKDNDITRQVWRKKRKAYMRLNLTIVTPSSWLAKCARRSSLLSDVSTVVIPNCLDTTVFKPIQQGLAKEILNLPKDKSLILFGALSATSDKRKGFRYLLEALEELTHTASALQDRVELVVFGASRSADMDDLPFTAHFLGRLSDDYTLALCYNAADVFVSPSVEEAFGQTLSEAMACGVPVVAFDYSGPTDIVDHKQNGYLAEYKSSSDLARGIKWVLKHEGERGKLGKSARQAVLSKYSLETVGKRYLELYSKILD